MSMISENTNLNEYFPIMRIEQSEIHGMNSMWQLKNKKNKHMKKRLFALAFILMTVMIVSCEEDSDSEDEGVNYESSHNTGKNCLSCHSSFKLAGSVYNQALTSAYAGAKIKVT